MLKLKRVPWSVTGGASEKATICGMLSKESGLWRPLGACPAQDTIEAAVMLCFKVVQDISQYHTSVTGDRVVNVHHRFKGAHQDHDRDRLITRFFGDKEPAMNAMILTVTLTLYLTLTLI